MKIILAAMAAVIVILVVALGASLMGKPDVVVREVPERVVPNPRPAFTGNENRQRQSQNRQEIARVTRTFQSPLVSGAELAATPPIPLDPTP